jgi:sec-independent protein translocase protein TatA
MLGDLFDSPWKILIIAIVILVLFGSRKLPDAARSLGRSMRILKTEISDLHDDEQPASPPAAAVPVPPAAAPQIGNQQQVDALQAQIDELRKQAAANDAHPTQTTQAS